MSEYEGAPIYGWPVEILSLTVVQAMGKPGVALMLRPDPEDNLSPLSLLLSQEQAVFLRDVLNDQLNDKQSFLYLAKKAQPVMRLPEDFDLTPQPQDDIPF